MITAADMRIARLVSAMDAAGVDCFLAWDPVTMGYLQGFHEGSHERFLVLAIRKDGRIRLICPALSVTQAKRSGIQDVRGWVDGEDPLELFGQLSSEWDLESAIIAVDAVMPARLLLQLEGELPAALFRNGDSLVSGVMSVKEPDELEAMRRAAKIADEAFDEVLPQIKAGMTERAVSKLLTDAMAARGGTPTFSIVATGPNGAEPHHLTDNSTLRSGDVVILDFGCEESGYQSDITRTIAIGSASDEARKVYETVFAAHMAARQSIRPGVPCEDVDRAARLVIENAGYGPQFVHRTGHGIGTNVHEHPNIVAGNSDPLAPGNCFSIEPGIYLEGKFGVRIENIVSCTRDGHESFNVDPSPKLIVTA